MARKRQHGATGSSNQGQEGGDGGEIQRFTTPEAHKEFLRLIQRTVIKERGLLPSETDGAIFRQIQDRGWETVCETPRRCH